MDFTTAKDGINRKENQDKVSTIEEKLNETTPLPDQEDQEELNSCVDLERFYHLEREYGM